jgi:uncharacterized protein YacL
MLFSLLEIDLNFMMTFLFAIFTIAISIFFYNESTKATNMLQKMMLEIKGKVEHIDNYSKTEGLNILSTSIGDSKIKGVYKKDGKN